MRSVSAFVLSLLAGSACAAPGSGLDLTQKRAVCNADNCLRAVRASSAKPSPSSAIADCSSFMRTTVTPCAVTSTTTTTVTATAPPTSVTTSVTVLQTQVNTVFDTLISVVTTIEDTLTVVQPSQVQVTNTIFSPVTVTSAAPAKRAAGIPPLPSPPAILDHLKARAVSTCPATTQTPTRVPAYASACSGTARYSSACSCAGVTGSTTTLVAATTTATATSTVTYTPTSTVTATLTNTVPVTVVQTQIIPTAFETTDATAIVPSLYTVTTDVVVPTTVVVAPPVCSTYKFVATNGQYAGQFLSGDTPPTNQISYGFVTFVSSLADSSPFVLRPDGKVYGDNTYGWVTDSETYYYVLQMTDQSESAYSPQVDWVYCNISNGGSSYSGAVGTLACSYKGHSIGFYACSATSNRLVQSQQDLSGYGCTKVSFAALLACT